MDITFIESLVTATNGSKPKGRRIWSIDLQAVWLPYFTATNAMGKTNLDADALGAPLRLAYNPDGTVKFNPRSGKPTVKVAKPLSEQVKLARENLVAGLQNYAHYAFTQNEEAYKGVVAAAQAAGKPIIERDRAMLASALAEAVAEAEAVAVAEAGKGKARGKAREPVAVG